MNYDEWEAKSTDYDVYLSRRRQDPECPKAEREFNESLYGRLDDWLFRRYMRLVMLFKRN